MSALVQILLAGEAAPASAPSSYMASVRVEIAWNAGYATAPSLRTWTDVTDYVELAEGITISWGRQNERSQADANQLSLTLDNSDGRFTAGLSSSPYYPYVKLDRPIRVIATPVDGTESVRFLGFITEWPVAWDGTSAYAKATITASSRLSRLGYTAGLKSIIEQTILADSPVAYYTLGEPSGATRANDSSGFAAEPLVVVGPSSKAAVVFGSATGPGTDGLTAVQVRGTTDAGGVVAGQYLASAFTGGTSAYTFESFFLLDPATLTTSGILITAKFVGLDVVLGATVGGGIYGQHGGTTVSSGSTYLDGHTHHAAMTWDGSTLTVYVDGVSVGSSAVATALTSPADMRVGYGLTGVLAHVARYTSALSSTKILAHATAGLTGFASEALDVRADRYLGYANVPSTEINTEASNVTVQHVDTTDKQVVELLRALETTEGGVLYDERDGTTTLHNRAHRYTTASSFTLDMAQQQVEADYQPTLDRTYILNDVSAQDTSGVYTGRKTDATSVADYGPMTASVETASTDDDAPLNHASWLVSAYKDPRIRVPALSVDALAQVGKTPNCATVMAATVGTKITVSNHPSQAATSSATYFIEGGTEVYGPESLKLTWNVSPTAPWDQVLVIGDATRGVIGTNPIAF